MLSGGADPPRPPSNDSNGKGTTAKKRRYMIRLLPPRDSLTSLIPSPSSVSILVRPPYVLHLHHHYLRLKLDHLYVMLMHVDHLRYLHPHHLHPPLMHVDRPLYLHPHLPLPTCS